MTALLPVLLYHRIGPAQAGSDPGVSISPAKFERQVRWLAENGYSGIRPSQWLAWRRGQAGLPAKPVLVTLDDGYADIAEHALPVLQRYGFGAVVYIVTGLLGGRSEWLRDKTGRASFPLMSTGQVREWATRGIEFGGHSRSHCDLAALSPEAVAEEVAGCQQDLITILGKPMASFAYPYGSHSAAICGAVASVFDLAVTCEAGLNDSDANLHLLRRNMVNPGDSLIEFACKVKWGRNPIGKLRSRVRLRSRAFGFAGSVKSGKWFTH